MSALVKRLNLSPVTKDNVDRARLLIEAIIPVRYSDDFYTTMANSPSEFTRLGYLNDTLVGVVACRTQFDGKCTSLYLMVLAVAAPYRDRGIGEEPNWSLRRTSSGNVWPCFAGSELLRHVVEAARARGLHAEMRLHVHVLNGDALRFYVRHGFEVRETVQNYYTRGVDTPHAHLLVKRLSVEAAST